MESDGAKCVFLEEFKGKDQKPFSLIKFRTMKVNTPSMASHLINEKSVTKFGRIIRLLKLIIAMIIM